MSTAELPPSKLGTKEYWDNVYEEELANFQENGDEGEIWFGTDAVERMVDWVAENVPASSNPHIVEIGCGNGTLLFALLEAGYAADHLSGIDYSPGAVKLAQSIANARGQSITFSRLDFLQDCLPRQSGQHESGESVWDLLLDKGTFDAIALGAKDESGKSPAAKYPGRVSRLLKPGGFFLITSCNFTEEELQDYFATKNSQLTYHSRIQHPTYEYGGKKGSVCSSVAFKKVGL